MVENVKPHIYSRNKSENKYSNPRVLLFSRVNFQPLVLNGLLPILWPNFGFNYSFLLVSQFKRLSGLRQHDSLISRARNFLFIEVWNTLRCLKWFLCLTSKLTEKVKQRKKIVYFFFPKIFFYSSRITNVRKIDHAN